MTESPGDAIDQLLRRASEVRRNAYSMYSGYAVGAAVLTDGGLVYSGCNVENISYGLSMCAERNAVASAVVNCASPPVNIVAVAIVAGPEDAESSLIPDAVPVPCGGCLQVLAEFAGPHCAVICARATPLGVEEPEIYDLAELLPYRFGDSHAVEETE